MFPIISERDVKVVSWLTSTLALSTSTVSSYGDDCYMASDGLVHQDFGVATVKALSLTFASSRMASFGINMAGPEVGEEYTLYSYNAHAMCVDPLIVPVLFCAVSIATVTSNTVGDLVEHFSIIGTADAVSGSFNTLNKEGVVAVPKTDDVAVGRGICFGIGFMSHASASGGFATMSRLSVRRLMRPSPPIIESRKL